MRDTDWEILSILYETRNITKTAEMMYMTQPTLTRRLQQIEEDLGAVLLTRSNKGVQFTAEGSFAALKAREIMQAISGVREGIALKEGGELKGTLRLGAPKSYLHSIVPKILGGFSEEYPEVTFEIHTDLSHELLRTLEARQLDVGFVRGDIHTTLHKELLSRDQIYILAREFFDIEELPSMPRIDYAKEETVVAAIDRWWKERFDRQPHVRMSVYSGEICVEMIRHGLGYGIFSDGQYNDPADGFYALPLEFKNGTSFTRPSWMVYDESAIRFSRVTEAFIDYVHDMQAQIWLQK